MEVFYADRIGCICKKKKSRTKGEGPRARKKEKLKAFSDQHTKRNWTFSIQCQNVSNEIIQHKKDNYYHILQFGNINLICLL